MDVKEKIALVFRSMLYEYSECRHVSRQNAAAVLNRLIGYWLARHFTFTR